jgi:hypothetical protein
MSIIGVFVTYILDRLSRSTNRKSGLAKERTLVSSSIAKQQEIYSSNGEHHQHMGIVPFLQFDPIDTTTLDCY